HLVEVNDLADAAAAQVHEGLGLDQEDLLAVLEQFGNLGLEAALEPAGVGARGQQVNDGKADVVPGAVVAAARVAQADDDFGGAHGRLSVVRCSLSVGGGSGTARTSDTLPGAGGSVRRTTEGQ